MLLGLWLAKNLNQVRGVMVAGASCLLALSIWLTIYFIQERAAGNTAEMLLTYSVPWFKPLNIAYSVGVDGISVVMLLLSSIIVFTGTFASWQLKPLTKEYFLWFTLLSTGVFGFFISTDLFTMFMFYEVALIPMYLLIGVWGSGHKEYSAMKLTLMLMGGSALLILGLLGIYYFNGIYSGNYTFELTTIAANHCIPGDIQNVFFPFIFIGFGVLGALFPFHTWSPDGHASAPTYAPRWCAHEIGRLWLLPCSHVSVARGCSGSVLDIPDSDYYLCCLWCLLCLCTNRLEVYQCLFFSFSLRTGALRTLDDESDCCDWCCAADVEPWFDDGSLLRLDRYDLRTYPYS